MIAIISIIVPKSLLLKNQQSTQPSLHHSKSLLVLLCKITAQNLINHQDEYDCSADRSYFETGHRNRPVDAVGDAVERC